jgi:hypothetical protein
MGIADDKGRKESHGFALRPHAMIHTSGIVENRNQESLRAAMTEGLSYGPNAA